MNDIDKLKIKVDDQKRQIAALLVPNPKILDQTIFIGKDKSLISAYINSFGEAWISEAPVDDHQCDNEATMSTSTDYPMGIKVGDGYDPRGWQESLISRQQEDIEFKAPTEHVV